MTIEKKHKRLNEIGYLALIAIGVAMSLVFAQKYSAISILVILVTLLMASWLIARFDLHDYLLMIMAFILPFSVELPITENINIFVPSEPLLALILFTLGWEVLKKPSILKELFAGESKWPLPLLLIFIISMIFSTMLAVSVKFSIINISYLIVFFLWQKLLIKERPDFFPKLLILFSLSQLVVLVFSFYQLS